MLFFFLTFRYAAYSVYQIRYIQPVVVLRSMTDVIYLYAGCILSSILAAFVVSGVKQFNIERRCRRLELRLVDLEDAALSVRGKVAANARWKQDDWTKEVMAAERRPQKEVKRYANDPLVESE